MAYIYIPNDKHEKMHEIYYSTIADNIKYVKYKTYDFYAENEATIESTMVLLKPSFNPGLAADDADTRSPVMPSMVVVVFIIC